MSIIQSIFLLFIWGFFALLAFIFIFSVLLRIVRRFHQFPIPPYIARVIDNPVRRRIQPPDKLAEWMSVGESMSILEIGPGPGTFTFAVARRAGESGCLHAIDIQESIIKALQGKVGQQGIANISLAQASAHNLPFPDHYFDLIFMVTVLGEIPDKLRALTEFKRVLNDDGSLAIGEFLPDPDYPRSKTVIAWCREAGFIFAEKFGNVLHYLLLFNNQG